MTARQKFNGNELNTQTALVGANNSFRFGKGTSRDHITGKDLPHAEFDAARIPRGETKEHFRKQVERVRYNPATQTIDCAPALPNADDQISACLQRRKHF